MSTAEIHPDGLPSPRLWWAAIAVWLAMAMTVLDTAIANVALPTIAHDFGAAPSESIWIVNAYQLATVTTLLPLASLGEIVGYRLVCRAGLALFTVASLACAFSHSMGMLTAARTLQGLGAAGVMSVNGALIRHIYPNARLGQGIGFNAMVVSASSAIGPTVASGILALGPWQWLFGVNIPVGVAALVLGWRALPENVLAERRFDWLSAAMNAMTFGLVISGIDVLTRTKAQVLGAVETLSGLAVGGLLVLRELARPRPLVPVDLLRNPMFALSVATSITTFSAQMLAFVALPFHFENHLHFGQVETGLLLTPWPAMVGVFAPIAGWLADRLSTAVLCAIGLAVFCAGLSALALMPAAPSVLDICWRMALCGIGFGLFQSPNNRMMLTSAPRERAGAAGGMLGTARLTGQTIGAVLIAIFLHLFHDAGEVIGFWVSASLAALAACVSLSRMAVRTPAPPAPGLA
ncbi:MAG TPA: MFS transporter [Caulobacteraceae bacterium]|jgi:DHA2 family multidrug resistance protein-like MFS transporter|nr:MFS transporter [Caulobacteraceae bacterium]